MDQQSVFNNVEKRRNKTLFHLYDFKNKKALFPGIQWRVCLLYEEEKTIVEYA